MPYCPIDLHDNVLQANWTPANLKKVIIISYSFHRFQLSKAVGLTKLKAAVESSNSLLHEVPLPPTEVREISPSVSRAKADVYAEAFTDLSWHFFDWDGSLHRFQRQDPLMFDLHYVEIKRKVEDIIKIIHVRMEKLEKSSYYRKIMEQMQDLEMVRVKNVIGKGKAFPTSTTIFRITGSSPWYSSEAVE